jgi:ferredoxin-like protein FixX
MRQERRIMGIDIVSVFNPPKEEIQCAACGHIGVADEFKNSSVHKKFKICPKCGTVRFVCDENKDYRK